VKAPPSPGNRIWLVNLFLGGTAPTGALMESVALELQRRGCQVEIVAGDAGYNRDAAEGGHRFSGTVHALHAGNAAAAGFKGRLRAWLLFYLDTLRFAFTRGLPDTVVVMTTPPYLPLIFVARNWLARRRAELVLWNQDTYPEVLASVGLVKAGSLPFAALSALQRFGVRRVDRTIVLDRAMKEILEHQGARQVRIIPNWELPGPPLAVEGALSPALQACLARARAGWKHLVLYTGNYGWGHDLEILFQHLRAHPEQRDFFFLFVGGGEKWAALDELQRQVSAVAAFPYVSRAALEVLRREADLGLVALEQSCVGLMSPSKIHGYLLAGKPLLYLGPAGSNVADAIDDFQCGFRVAERDPAALSDCLARIARGEVDLAALGARARQAAAARYVEEVGATAVATYIIEEGGRSERAAAPRS
jgi:colanic acid biosynthesis glycosyl transferase WcaI